MNVYQQQSLLQHTDYRDDLQQADRLYRAMPLKDKVE